jgi:3-isopropylmalate/(R)-2-methylmalate dehydratase large subunit
MNASTFAEKILAYKAGKSVVPGQTVDVVPDLAVARDSGDIVIREFKRIGSKAIFDPSRIAIVLDNAAPPPNTRYAQAHKVIRQFAFRQRIQRFFEVGSGICHQVLPEAGLVKPGMLVVGIDSRSTSYGAFGAFGTCISFKEMAEVWATGRIRLQVPETVRIAVSGHLSPFVTAKDVALSIVGHLRVGGTDQQSVELYGSLIDSMNMEDRQVIANMLAELGASNVFVTPNEAVVNWLRHRGVQATSLIHSDPEAIYTRIMEYDFTDLEPMVARPGCTDRVVPVSDVVGTPIDQALIGSCTNGRLSDLALSAAILEKRSVSPRCRLYITPASRSVYIEAIRKGYIQTLVEAGAVVNSPGCGPCKGHHMGIPAPGDSVISSGSHNAKGRMGTIDAEIYLASPAVVAASAISGKITDPRGLQAD